MRIVRVWMGSSKDVVFKEGTVKVSGVHAFLGGKSDGKALGLIVVNRSIDILFWDGNPRLTPAVCTGSTYNPAPCSKDATYLP